MPKGVVTPFKPRAHVHDQRCSCGSLLAKITSEGVEIKCRKCKRVQLIPFPRGYRLLSSSQASE